jgi:hypothetical protein
MSPLQLSSVLLPHFSAAKGWMLELPSSQSQSPFIPGQGGALRHSRWNPSPSLSMQLVCGVQVPGQGQVKQGLMAQASPGLHWLLE